MAWHPPPCLALAALKPRLRSFGRGRHGSKWERHNLAAHMRERKAQRALADSKANQSKVTLEVLSSLRGRDRVFAIKTIEKTGFLKVVNKRLLKRGASKKQCVASSGIIAMSFQHMGTSHMVAPIYRITEAWVNILRYFVAAMYLAYQELQGSTR